MEGEILLPATSCVSKCISKKSFPDELKIREIVHRPVSLFPFTFKIFDKKRYEQIEKLVEKILSPLRFKNSLFRLKCTFKVFKKVPR